MNIKFRKYHAIGNDFILFDERLSVTKRRLPALAEAICDRRTGVGADGILCIGKSKQADCKVDIYNADGSWA
ncbi:MAG: diaminopimelate epimerase, partial [Candidatus Zixiibacteriota bacterium]